MFRQLVPCLDSVTQAEAVSLSQLCREVRQDRACLTCGHCCCHLIQNTAMATHTNHSLYYWYYLLLFQCSELFIIRPFFGRLTWINPVNPSVQCRRMASNGNTNEKTERCSSQMAKEHLGHFLEG